MHQMPQKVKNEEYFLRNWKSLGTLQMSETN
jgi:hypothetical protein